MLLEMLWHLGPGHPNLIVAIRVVLLGSWPRLPRRRSRRMGRLPGGKLPLKFRDVQLHGHPSAAAKVSSRRVVDLGPGGPWATRGTHKGAAASVLFVAAARHGWARHCPLSTPTPVRRNCTELKRQKSIPNQLNTSRDPHQSGNVLE